MVASDGLKPKGDGTDGLRRGYWAVFVVVLAVAALLRLGVAWGASAIGPDAAYCYLPLAQSVAEGSHAFGMDVSIPPLYPWLGGLLAKILGDLEWSCRMVSVMAGIGTVGFGMLLAHRLFGKWPGLLTGALLAGHPYLVRFGADVGVDSLAVCWFTASAFFLVCYLHRPTIWRIACLAPALVLLTLSRPEGVIYSVLFFILAIFCPVAGKWFDRRRMVHGLMLAVVFLACLVPRLIWVHQETSSWVVDVRQVEWPVRLWDSIRSGHWNYGQIRFWRTHGLAGVAHTAESIGAGLGPVSLVFGIIGIVSARRRHAFPTAWIILVLIAAAFFVPAIGNRISRRYLLSASALWQIWAGLGVSVTVMFFYERYLRSHGIDQVIEPRKLSVRMLVCCLLLVAINLPMSLVRLHHNQLCNKRVGEWILAHLGPGRRIMTCNSIPPWYAQGIELPAPGKTRGGYEPDKRFQNHLAETQAELLLVHARDKEFCRCFQAWQTPGNDASYPLLFECNIGKKLIRVYDVRGLSALSAKTGQEN